MAKMVKLGLLRSTKMLERAFLGHTPIFNFHSWVSKFQIGLVKHVGLANIVGLNHVKFQVQIQGFEAEWTRQEKA